MAENKQEAQLTIYQEVCNSYRAIDDFRAKLLGFLPLVSGTGLFLLLGGDIKQEGAMGNYMGVIGVFGFIITLGLFFYELRGIQRCNSLIAVGEQLEKNEFKIDGQFGTKLKPIAGFIRNTLAAQIIYPAVSAGWIYVALVSVIPLLAIWAAGFVFIVGFAISYQLKDELKYETNTSDLA